MAVHLCVLLIFSGLTGIHSITTVSQVSARPGGSISIPCLYEPKYKRHVKYLCKGQKWSKCTYEVKTNQPSSSGKFSISDDTHQRIFTVTINDLSDDDTDYWCVVEINNRADVGEYFKLTRGPYQLSVDHQEITGFNGEDVTIRCHYSVPGLIQWCRLRGPCLKESSGSIHATRVTITEDVPKAFTVTMCGLRTENSGWYFCGKGNQQMPVHVTVKDRPSTSTTTLTTPTFTATTHLTTLSPTAESTTIQIQSGNHSASIHPLSFTVPLTLLIFMMMVASFIWFVLRRHKQNKAQSSAATETEEEITYSAVKRTRKTPNKVEATDQEVTYSTLAQH